ncbi:MAG TPA: hypothetical protein VKN63_00020 [Afifellaceae bacterium]|nr:hypothetical protein [Afifellaceae bacterium]
MTAAQAKMLERMIIGLCLLSIFAVFQPFAMWLYSVGCVTVVISALIFNLIPFCREGVPARTLYRVSAIVLIVLVAAMLFGIGTALLYVEYLAATR